MEPPRRLRGFKKFHKNQWKIETFKPIIKKVFDSAQILRFLIKIIEIFFEFLINIWPKYWENKKNL